MYLVFATKYQIFFSDQNVHVCKVQLHVHVHVVCYNKLSRWVSVDKLDTLHYWESILDAS